MLEKRSDRDLKQRILRELKWDSRIDWASINVEVNDGVVTLTGTVPSYAQKSPPRKPRIVSRACLMSRMTSRWRPWIALYALTRRLRVRFVMRSNGTHWSRMNSFNQRYRMDG